MSRLNKREFTLYALLCDDEAIYVGTCEKDRFEKRYLEHKSGKGSQFTSAYKYGTIEKIYAENHDEEDVHDRIGLETNLTFCLMKSFGYKNVRGGQGAWKNVILKKDPTINEEHIDRWADEPVEDIIEEIFNIIHEKYPKSKLVDEFFIRKFNLL